MMKNPIMSQLSLRGPPAAPLVIVAVGVKAFNEWANIMTTRSLIHIWGKTIEKRRHGSTS